MYYEWIFAFLLLSSMAWILIGVKDYNLLKCIYIVSIITGSVLIFQKISQYQGTALALTEHTLPNEFIHYGSKIDETNQIIYMLIVPMDDDIPMLISTPYEPTKNGIETFGRKLHKAIIFGVSTYNGEPFRIVINGNEDPKKSGNKNPAGSLSGASPTTIDISGLPEPKLPRKNMVR